MIVTVTPSKAYGKVNAPPSKSMAHRALICGALSGNSRVENLSYSRDINATLACLKALGASTFSDDDSVVIGGLNVYKPETSTELFCDESGSTLRFMIPLCLVCDKPITLKGSTRLFERPLTIYENICKEQGFLFEKQEDSLTVCGRLKSGFYSIPGNISSQFITGMLFALPLLDGVSIIEITGDFESASYIDLTLSVLSDFGIRITRVENRFIIMGNQKYKDTIYRVEGDASNAAFLDALTFVGGEVSVGGLKIDSLQGDRVYADIFDAMSNGVKEFDLSDCPDLAPILFAVSALKGGVLFTGTKRLRIKESDRGEAMAAELRKFGVKVEIGENHVLVYDSPIKTPTEILDGHNDHRIVMALTVLCTVTGGVINGAEAVSKSFPNFFEVLKTLRIGIDYDS